MPYEPLYKNIFGKEISHPSATEDLQNITARYPFFSVAHFYLLKQTPVNSADYDKIAARTALHFNNVFLLNQQLNRVKKEVILAPSEEANIDEVKVEPIITQVPEEVVKAVAEEKTATHPTASDPILFEPLHTTDYFASQGIKITDEVQPTDKLGKQLKSFTEWLKTMKKVHESKLPEGSDQLDTTVNKLAEKSNKETEVVTEAMAEAFLQQGKKEKAKDIYLKLSLLNPSKNAYFAAKSEEIK